MSLCHQHLPHFTAAGLAYSLSMAFTLLYVWHMCGTIGPPAFFGRKCMSGISFAESTSAGFHKAYRSSTTCANTNVTQILVTILPFFTILSTELQWLVAIICQCRFSCAPGCIIDYLICHTISRAVSCLVTLSPSSLGLHKGFQFVPIIVQDKIQRCSNWILDPLVLRISPP